MTAHPQAQNDVQKELWTTLISNSRVAIMFNVVNAATCAAVIKYLDPDAQMLWWTLAQAGVTAVRGLLAFLFARVNPSGPRRAVFGLLTFTQGVLWGAAPFLTAGASDPMATVVVSFMIAGMTAGSAVSLLPSTLTFASYAAPAIAGLFAYFVMQMTFAGAAAATTLSLYLGMIVVLVRRYRVVLVENIIKTRNIAQKNLEIEGKNAALYELAHYDSLTGAGNRKLLEARSEEILDDAIETRTPCAFFHVDLDHFKHINDSLGHSFGDVLLNRAVDRLRGCFRHTDLVFRLGGDEFAVLAKDFPNERAIDTVAEKIVETMARPFEIFGNAVNCRASVGVAVFPNHGSSVDELMKYADLALQQAKASGRACHRICTSDMISTTARLNSMEEQLRLIVEERRFAYLYQPIIRLDTRELVGLEVLINFNDADALEATTDELIRIAEKIGVIRDLTDSLVSRGLAPAKRIFSNIATLEKISINLGPVELRRHKTLKGLQLAIDSGMISPEQLQIEVTENSILDRGSDLANEMITAMADRGVSIVLDDFGTGYSSLTHLQTLPISGVKIDKSFVRHICVDKNDQAIVQSIIALCRSLNLSVTCEGVEHDEQCGILEELKPDYLQGYLFARPLRLEELLSTFATRDTEAEANPEVNQRQERRRAPLYQPRRRKA